MRKLRTKVLNIIVILMASAFASTGALACEYRWGKVTEQAAFRTGYNFPVFRMGDGSLLAVHDGGWRSTDSRTWTRTQLGDSGLNSAYQQFVQLNDAVYALGALKGNYLGFTLDRTIKRTRDGRRWEVVDKNSNIPARVFYGANVFNGRIWLFGGFDGKRYYNDVWSSDDAVTWRREAESAAWTPRTASRTIVFRNRIWLFGGGVIDGEANPNPGSDREIWSSADGVNWERAKVNGLSKLAGTPVVFDDRLWLLGANRNDGNFASATLVTQDGENWRELSAPWSPRGGVAAWVFGDKLYISGGKFSFVERGVTKFVYSNDIWEMRRS